MWPLGDVNNSGRERGGVKFSLMVKIVMPPLESMDVFMAQTRMCKEFSWPIPIALSCHGIDTYICSRIKQKSPPPVNLQQFCGPRLSSPK